MRRVLAAVKRQSASDPAGTQLPRTDRVHIARSGQGRQNRQRFRRGLYRRPACWQSSRRPVAPASGWNSALESCASRRSDAYKEVQDFNIPKRHHHCVDGKLASRGRARSARDSAGEGESRHQPGTGQAGSYRARAGTAKRQGKASISPIPSSPTALSNPVITKLRQAIPRRPEQGVGLERPLRSGSSSARNLRAEMAALQRAIWDEISRIAESYKSELQIAKSQEESIDKRMGEVFSEVGDDAAITGPLARAGDRGKYLPGHLRDLPVPLHINRCSSNPFHRRKPGSSRSPPLPISRVRTKTA